MKSRSGKTRLETPFRKVTLKNRLWFLQISLVVAIITGTIIVLILTGTFEILNNQSIIALNDELERTAASITRRFFIISQNTYELGEKVNQSINRSLENQGLTASDLQTHPEILENLLDKEVEKAIFTMQKSNCSGVFIVLDATLNPTIPNAKYSKSGFYIRDIEPHPVPYSTNILQLLRGSPNIARNYDMYLDTEWQLEFETNISHEGVKADFYYKPYYAAVDNKDISTRSLGYWSSPFKIDINTKKALTFSIPLRNKEGIVYGVCGLELSEHFFNSHMLPIPEDYDRLFYLVGIKENNHIYVSESIHLGKYSARFVSAQPKFLTSSYEVSGKKEFRNYYFESDNKNPVVGLETKLNIYPSQSVFKDVPWVLTALLPPDDVTKTKAVFLSIGLILLFLLGISITYYTSRFYTKPISLVFKQIIDGAGTMNKTNIVEIDDLIEFLKQDQVSVEESKRNDETHSSSPISTLNTQADSTNNSLYNISGAQYNEFSKQLASLTKTEREIFDMYIHGYSAKQICEIRCLSINTVKTHNRRIYAKLNVSSRSELLAYCYHLMRQSSSIGAVSKN